jgi:hypothetical protein
MTIAHPAHHPNGDTRELRALQLYRKHGQEIHHVGEDLYLVPRCTGRGFYTVDYAVEVCDCPDFQYHQENCKHILAVGIYVAKRRLRVSVAGDPFAAAGGDHDHDRPCACLDGWVYVGYEDEYGEEREAAYRCRRCADSR